MDEERLAQLEKWIGAHEPYWQNKHAGSGIDTLASATRDLIAEVRRLRAPLQERDAP